MIYNYSIEVELDPKDVDSDDWDQPSDNITF